MKLKYFALLLLLGLCTAGLHAQCILVLPPVNSTAWGTPLNNNFTCLNNYFDGTQTITTLIATGALQGSSGIFGTATVSGNASIGGNLLFPNGTSSTISTAGSAINAFLANRGYNQGVLEISVSSYTVTQNDCGNLILFNNGANVAITVPNANAVTTMCDIHIIAPIAHTATITASVSGQINSASAYGANSFTVAAAGDVELISNGSLWLVASVTTPGSGSGGMCSGLAANQVCGWNGTSYVPVYVDGFMNPATIQGGLIYSPSNGVIQSDVSTVDDGAGNISVQSIHAAAGLFGTMSFTSSSGFPTPLVKSIISGVTKVNISSLGNAFFTALQLPTGQSLTAPTGTVSSETSIMTAAAAAIASNTNCLVGDGNGGGASSATLQCLTGTTATPLGGTTLSGGSCSSGTVAVSGATVGRPVVVSAADGSTLSGQFYPPQATVSSTGVVTVRICAAAGGTGGTPAAVNYNVTVM